MSRILRGATLAAIAIACAACGGSADGERAPDGGAAAAPALRPEPDRFRTGTCRDAAPAILAIGAVAARLADEQAVSQAEEKMLTAHQATLRKLKPSADLRKPTQDVVTAIGFIRIRLNGNTYEAELVNELATAQQRLVAACTAG
jgi:hypothetical protein